MKYLTWRWWLFFIFIAFAFAGTRPLGEPDEGRYAEAARELYLSGNWLVPQLQGHPHLTKPAFTYWAAAAGYRLLGINEWGARLFLSLAYLLTILVVIELAKTWGWRRQAALASGLIFATALVPCAAGHLLTTDMFLTFWETLGVLSLWKVWRGDARVNLWRWVFWIAFGFAFLTKGPVGWLPLLPLLAFVWISRNQRRIGGIWSWPAFGTFVLISLAWYLALIVQDAHKLYYFIHDEVGGHLVSDQFNRNKPFWFYFAVLVGGLTPWFFLWPSFLARLWKAIRPEKSGATGARDWLARLWQKLRALEDIRLFSLLWVVIMFAIFMLAKSKMLLYLLPLFVPIAIWCGRLLVEKFPAILPRRGSSRVLALGLAALWMVAFLAMQAGGEKFAGDRFLRGLSRQIVAAKPANVNVIYSLDRPSHSLTFYTGLTLVQLDDKYKKKSPIDKKNMILPYLRAEQKAGRPALLEINKSRLKKLSDRGYRVIAEDKKLVVIQATDAPTTATGDKSIAIPASGPK